MVDPRELQPGDVVWFKETDPTDEFRGHELRVTDTSLRNLGVTEVFVATLVVGCEPYSLQYAAGESEATVEPLDGDAEYTVGTADIVIE